MNIISKSKILLLSLTCLFSNTNAFSWWDQAHQLIGYSAGKTVTPKTYEKVTQILKFPIESIGNTKLNKNTSEFDTAASWADSIKALNPQNSYYFCHFIEIPTDKSLVGTTIDDTFGKNALNAILNINQNEINSIVCVKSLVKGLVTNTLTPEEEAIAVRILIHIVGDIGQPLHSMSIVENSEKDDGGNKTYFPEEVSIPSSYGKAQTVIKLHALWDATLGYFLQFPFNNQTLYFAEYSKSDRSLNAHFSETLFAKKSSQDILNTLVNSEQSVENWVIDSYKIAIKNVYTDLSKGWGWYSVPRQEIVEKQIVKSSYRLALLLDAIFDPKHSPRSFQKFINNIKNDSSIKSIAEISK